MERQCRCRCRIKSVIVQLLWVGAQLPTLYNTVEYPGIPCWYNNNNNNIHICIAPYGRNFRGLAEARAAANRFSIRPPPPERRDGLY